MSRSIVSGAAGRPHSHACSHPGCHGRDRRLRFGVNYVPSRHWYYCWNDWDSGAISADLDALAALGIDHIRVQLVWSWFQPNPEYVSEAHLGRLRELLILADQRGMDVLICPLTGWLSGYIFLPPNMAGADIFTDDRVLEQSVRFFDAILRATADIGRNLLGFDLGNEINVLAPNLTAEQGDTWGRRITQAVRAHPDMAGRWLVNGVDHNPWFRGGVFSLDHLASDYDAVCLHAWPKFTGALLSGGLADAPATHLAAFMTSLARHAIRRAGAAENTPVWVQEFGASEHCGDHSEHESYMRETIAHSAAAGATWFTWWCSHDISESLRFDPFEYSLGLLTSDNKPKPAAHVYRDIIATLAHNPPAVETTPANDTLPDWHDAFAPRILRRQPAESWIDQNRHTSTWKLYEASLARIAATASATVA